jgi:hypothetical protein
MDGVKASIMEKETWKRVDMVDLCWAVRAAMMAPPHRFVMDERGFHMGGRAPTTVGDVTPSFQLALIAHRVFDSRESTDPIGLRLSKSTTVHVDAVHLYRMFRAAAMRNLAVTLMIEDGATVFTGIVSPVDDRDYVGEMYTIQFSDLSRVVNHLLTYMKIVL